MKQLIIVIALMYLTASSNAQTKNYNRNGGVKVVSDKTYLQIQALSDSVRIVPQSAGAVFGAILPPLIDVFTNGVKTISKNNVAKYQGQYSAFNSHSGFYSAPSSINLPKLTIRRSILKKGESSPTEAVMLELTPELSEDLSAFRYKLTAITYAYSKDKRGLGLYRSYC